MEEQLSREQKLSQEFSKLFGAIKAIKGVKDVAVDDNNGSSFQVIVLLDMYSVGAGLFDWRSDYGFYRETKRNLLSKVVREVKKAFRAIEGCTVTSHEAPQSYYEKYQEDYQGSWKSRHIGYQTRGIMVHCHWYPEEERIYI